MLNKVIITLFLFPLILAAQPKIDYWDDDQKQIKSEQQKQIIAVARVFTVCFILIIIAFISIH